MGDFEVSLLGEMESTVKYHPDMLLNLISYHESGGKTVLGG